MQIKPSNLALAPLIFLMLSACGHQMEPVAPVALAPLPASGTIWAASHYGALTENPTARRVGDILLVTLEEYTSASKSASAQAKRSSQTSIDLPSAKPFSYVPPGLLKGGANSNFKGDAGADQQNQLSGDISVVITAVRPHGILEISGEKKLRLGRGDESVRLSGLVRLADIGPDNRISSTQVAQARIAYVGQGELARSTQQGWLMRFFSRIQPF